MLLSSSFVSRDMVEIGITKKEKKGGTSP